MFYNKKLISGQHDSAVGQFFRWTLNSPQSAVLGIKQLLLMKLNTCTKT
jgi:hypothetical protein